jgi:hypothetical protein
MEIGVEGVRPAQHLKAPKWQRGGVTLDFAASGRVHLEVERGIRGAPASVQ